MPSKQKKQDEKVKTLVQLYMEGVGELPLLTAEEEVELSQKIESGDQEARQRMIRSNLRLVVSIAKGYVGKSLNLTLLGLIQEGNLGLMRAIENFDWRRGNRFSTYATWAIQSFIERALKYDARGEVADFSLDDPVGGDYEGDTMHGFVADEKAKCPATEAHRNFLQVVVDEILLELDPKEQKIIKLAFGLTDGIVHSDKEIANKLGISKERVRQIKGKTLKRLKCHKRLAKLK